MMKTIQFNTNITCSGCVAKATPTLDKIAGAANWKVDTGTPQKTLTVTTHNTAAAIIDALSTAGFKASVVAS